MHGQTDDPRHNSNNKQQWDQIEPLAFLAVAHSAWQWIGRGVVRGGVVGGRGVLGGYSPFQLCRELLVWSIIHLGIGRAPQRCPRGSLLLGRAPAVHLGVHTAPWSVVTCISCYDSFML